jgi:hypothetical protein
VKFFCCRQRAAAHRPVGADADDDDEDFHLKIGKLDAKLQAFFSSPLSAFNLEFELKTLVVYGRALADACYFLEKDLPVLPFVDEHLTRCRTKLSSGSLSTSPPDSSETQIDRALHEWVAVHAQEDPGQRGRDQLEQETRRHLQPARQYLLGQEAKYIGLFAVARAASSWLPWEYYKRNLTRDAINERLARFQLDEQLIRQCVSEMDDYRAVAQHVDTATDINSFWHAHRETLPGWFKAWLVVGLVQPSSAAVERGFSLFGATFGNELRLNSLESTMETQMKAMMNPYA